MATEDWLVIAALFACVAAAGVVACVARKRHDVTDAWMPRELKGHALAYSEKTFGSGGPKALVARVDRAYRDRGGRITLVELKTRTADRVHRSDIIELSAQRVALTGETGEAVASIAWVVVQTQAGRTAHRVHLMSTRAVLQLALRRDALLAGTVSPSYPATTQLCASCAHRRRCHRRADDL